MPNRQGQPPKSSKSAAPATAVARRVGGRPLLKDTTTTTSLRGTPLPNRATTSCGRLRRGEPPFTTRKKLPARSHRPINFQRNSPQSSATLTDYGCPYFTPHSPSAPNRPAAADSASRSFVALRRRRLPPCHPAESHPHHQGVSKRSVRAPLPPSPSAAPRRKALAVRKPLTVLHRSKLYGIWNRLSSPASHAADSAFRCSSVAQATEDCGTLRHPLFSFTARHCHSSPTSSFARSRTECPLGPWEDGTFRRSPPAASDCVLRVGTLLVNINLRGEYFLVSSSTAGCNRRPCRTTPGRCAVCSGAAPCAGLGAPRVRLGWCFASRESAPASRCRRCRRRCARR